VKLRKKRMLENGEIDENEDEQGDEEDEDAFEGEEKTEIENLLAG